MVFMDHEGNVLAKHDGDQNVEGIFQTGNAVKRLLACRAGIAAGDETLKGELFVLEVELGAIEFFEAKEKSETIELDAALRKRVDTALVNQEVMFLLEYAQGDQEKMGSVAKRFRQLLSKKQIPSTPRAQQNFFMVLFQDAQVRNDIPAFEATLVAMKKELGGEESATRMIESLEAGLAKLKEAQSLEEDKGDGE